MFPKKLSKRNKRGVVVLLCILAVITMTPRIMMWTQPEDPIIVSVEELNNGVSDIEYKYQKAAKQKNRKSAKFKRPASKFNPNDYQLSDWMKLGLSEKQAAVIIRFSKRGIHSNEQLKQIYVIHEDLFHLIKDSTYYPEGQKWQQKQAYETAPVQKQAHTKTDLNHATHEELLELPGIGEFYAKKIIEYREKLGGYISEQQLLELWKFDEEKFNKLKNRVFVDRNGVKQINVNTCTAEELSKHPYISWNVANSIVKMRGKSQKYTNFDQLLQSELISVELLEKIKPYLTLD